jgi:hypothetical protein
VSYPGIFDPVSIGRGVTGVRLVAASEQYPDPTLVLLEELKAQFGEGTTLSTIISIGERGSEQDGQVIWDRLIEDIRQQENCYFRFIIPEHLLLDGNSNANYRSIQRVMRSYVQDNTELFESSVISLHNQQAKYILAEQGTSMVLEWIKTLFIVSISLPFIYIRCSPILQCLSIRCIHKRMTLPPPLRNL